MENFYQPIEFFGVVLGEGELPDLLTFPVICIYKV